MNDSPINFANAIKWATIMMLFVVCGCLFINVRSQHSGKRDEIKRLRAEQTELTREIQLVEANIKKNLAPRVLEARLKDYQSDLRLVDVEKTESLSLGNMTVAR